jgi:predicted nucleotidyltransferase
VEIHSDISGCEFEDCLARSERSAINGVDVRFIGLNDLRRNKLAAGRTKDLADLEELPEA